MKDLKKRIEQVKKLKAKADVAAAEQAKVDAAAAGKPAVKLTPSAQAHVHSDTHRQNAAKLAQTGSGNLPVGRSSARKPGG
jgi:hypothetical protein